MGRNGRGRGGEGQGRECKVVSYGGKGICLKYIIYLHENGLVEANLHTNKIYDLIFA